MTFEDELLQQMYARADSWIGLSKEEADEKIKGLLQMGGVIFLEIGSTPSIPTVITFSNQGGGFAISTKNGGRDLIDKLHELVEAYKYKTIMLTSESQYKQPIAAREHIFRILKASGLWHLVRYNPHEPRDEWDEAEIIDPAWKRKYEEHKKEQEQYEQTGQTEE